MVRFKNLDKILAFLWIGIGFLIEARSGHYYNKPDIFGQNADDSDIVQFIPKFREGQLPEFGRKKRSKLRDLSSHSIGKRHGMGSPDLSEFYDLENEYTNLELTNLLEDYLLEDYMQEETRKRKKRLVTPKFKFFNPEDLDFGISYQKRHDAGHSRDNRYLPNSPSAESYYQPDFMEKIFKFLPMMKRHAWRKRAEQHNSNFWGKFRSMLFDPFTKSEELSDWIKTYDANLDKSKNKKREYEGIEWNIDSIHGPKSNEHPNLGQLSDKNRYNLNSAIHEDNDIIEMFSN